MGSTPISDSVAYICAWMLTFEALPWVVETFSAAWRERKAWAIFKVLFFAVLNPLVCSLFCYGSLSLMKYMSVGTFSRGTILGTMTVAILAFVWWRKTTRLSAVRMEQPKSSEPAQPARIGTPLQEWPKFPTPGD